MYGFYVITLNICLFSLSLSPSLSLFVLTILNPGNAESFFFFFFPFAYSYKSRLSNFSVLCPDSYLSRITENPVAHRVRAPFMLRTNPILLYPTALLFEPISALASASSSSAWL
ncbi:hypothetical protein V8C37DRAFT_367494 [Trichoderma ceciliae]